MYSMFIQLMTSHIFLSTPVENPANLSNPVESGLVFEMVKSGLVRFRPNLLQSSSGPAPARVLDPVAHCMTVYQLTYIHSFIQINLFFLFMFLCCLHPVTSLIP